MFLVWSYGGAKEITLAGLLDQNYSFYPFDWITGKQIRTQDVATVQGALVLSDVLTREGRPVGYVNPERAPIVEKPEPRQTMLRLVFRDADSSTQDITLNLVAGRSSMVDTGTFETASPLGVEPRLAGKTDQASRLVRSLLRAGWSRD